jgi:outer membrane biosynthesis protein TonB
MPNTEHDPLDRGFDWRLKGALDRVTPPPSNPRYASSVMGGARAWPLVPALVAAGATVLLAISATAFTGSTNPLVWAERAGSTIQTVNHTPEAAPSPEPSPTTPRQAPAAPAQPTHGPDQQTKETPEPKESPEPKERTEPTDPPEPPSGSGNHSGQRSSPIPPSD